MGGLQCIFIYSEAISKQNQLFPFRPNLSYVHHWTLRRNFHKTAYLIIINAKKLSECKEEKCQLL
jgi:hypothetical protein